MIPSFNSEKNRKKCPCKKDCAERTAECHATCKRYKMWREMMDKELEERNAIAASIDTFSYDNKRKMWKNKTKSKGKKYQNGVGNY